jgi:hypothetical protein
VRIQEKEEDTFYQITGWARSSCFLWSSFSSLPVSVQILFEGSVQILILPHRFCSNLVWCIDVVETTDVKVRYDLVCEENVEKCWLKCYTGGGNCMRCCQAHGYVHGRCNIFLDNFCFCCKNLPYPPVDTDGNHGQQPQAGTPTPLPQH